MNFLHSSRDPNWGLRSCDFIDASLKSEGMYVFLYDIQKDELW